MPYWERIFKMGAISKLNEVDRETQKGFSSSSGSKSIETAGPLACLPEAVFMDDNAYDEFSTSNPFAGSYVDYTNYSQSEGSAPSETTYAIAMANMLSFGGDSSSDFSGGFDGGFSGGDCGFSGGGFSGGGGSDSFSASC